MLGEEHPDTAESLNDLALLYDQMEDYAKAEPLFQQALQIDRKVLGEEHPETATGLNNLAGLYVHMAFTQRPNRSCSKHSKSTKRC